jgi:hypothetical protein
VPGRKNRLTVGQSLTRYLPLCRVTFCAKVVAGDHTFHLFFLQSGNALRMRLNRAGSAAIASLLT